jgi:hypothetical protein
MSSVKLGWESAEVKDATLTVALQGEDDEGEERPEGPDAEMTERFRGFADDEEEDA